VLEEEDEEEYLWADLLGLAVLSLRSSAVILFCSVIDL
jgi:ribosomal 30S subunit maturation factor RimM